MKIGKGDFHRLSRTPIFKGLHLFLLALVLATGMPGQMTEEQLARVDRLEHALLAPCCYSETVADHHSQVALEMQDEIPRMVASGKTDREILDYYIAKYGERVLVEPEGKQWWVMNLVPVAFLIFGLVAAVLVLQKWRKPVPTE